MLGEVIEKHFEETAGHVRRISEMIYRFSQKLNFSHSESELLKVASTMHDIGKIGIPDAILKKRGRLTLEEFEQIQEHSIIGYKLLSKSKLEILKLSAEIALNHHEKFNGSGYPNGLIGHTIPYSARILAILDVFDAMTHKRVYKDACSKEEALEYIINQSGIHFDPELVKVFIQELEYIIGKQ
jgi:response regulator RpfG family c-di-GMP phosphodiesterase